MNELKSQHKISVSLEGKTIPLLAGLSTHTGKWPLSCSALTYRDYSLYSPFHLHFTRIVLPLANCSMNEKCGCFDRRSLLLFWCSYMQELMFSRGCLSPFHFSPVSIFFASHYHRRIYSVYWYVWDVLPRSIKLCLTSVYDNQFVNQCTSLFFYVQEVKMVD